ncbi:hypothetical protein CLBKND_03087 [Methylorubrum aminovorans]
MVAGTDGLTSADMMRKNEEPRRGDHGGALF